MPSNKKRLITYVSSLKHKNLKTFCAESKISISKFIDEAIQEKIDKERKKKPKIQ